MQITVPRFHDLRTVRSRPRSLCCARTNPQARCPLAYPCAGSLKQALSTLGNGAMVSRQNNTKGVNRL